MKLFQIIIYSILGILLIFFRYHIIIKIYAPIITQIISIFYPKNREYFLTDIEKNKSILLQNIPENESEETPSIIWQTYHDKTKIPVNVYENIKKYAPGYTHNILDDKDAIIFLKKFFVKRVAQIFESLTYGPHKADLLRYALLYVYGGVYLDIKTQLIENIDKTFPDKKIMYTFYNTHSRLIYQGIIVSPPKNPLFISLINFMLDSNGIHTYFYHIYCYDMLVSIKMDISDKTLKLGLNKGKYINYYIYKQMILDKSECPDGLDKYGFCSWGIHPETLEKIIKIRMENYPF